MRVRQMQYVYYDKTKKRYFAQLKKPPDVQSILGKVPFKHTFPQSIDRKTANRLSDVIVEEWEAEIATARSRTTTTQEPSSRPSGRFIIVSQTLSVMRRPGEPLDLSGPGRLITDRRGTHDLLVSHPPVPPRELQVPPRPEPPKVAACSTATAIALWRVKRGDDQPKQQAIDGRESKMAKFLAWAKKPDDLTLVLQADIQRYKEHLVAAHTQKRLSSQWTELARPVRPSTRSR